MKGFAGKLEAKKSLGESGINGKTTLKWNLVDTEGWRGVD
jgi:hypothetical protein